MSADVFFYVQHLLGIGHIRRAALIARACSEAGLAVTFVSGGEPVAGLDIGAARLLQLDPPLRSADAQFSRLETPTGRVLDEAIAVERRDQLLAAFERERPSVLLTEMFPFGRRQMRFELTPLVERARAAPWRPALAASVRDILTAIKDRAKVDWIVATVERFYDRVLVHGDPALVPFNLTFPEAERLADRLAYTGYVVAEAPPAPQAVLPGGEVLVSTGGGAVADPLVEAAFGARALSPLATAPWRVLIGDNLPEARFRAFQRAAPAGIAVERSRRDFLSLLAACRLSISQAGYNTTLEVLAAGRPAVVVPFAAGQESEQRLRARLLAEQGRLVVVEEAGLTPALLAAGIARALALPPAAPLSLALDGAARSAAILAGLARQGSGR
jgi:predicted glycosyltransferase